MFCEKAKTLGRGGKSEKRFRQLTSRGFRLKEGEQSAHCNYGHAQGVQQSQVVEKYRIGDRKAEQERGGDSGRGKEYFQWEAWKEEVRASEQEGPLKMRPIMGEKNQCIFVGRSLMTD